MTAVIQGHDDRRRYARRVVDEPTSDAPTGADLEVRTDYEWGTLLEADAPDDPWELLGRWLSDAQAAGEAEFNAMALATVDPTGQPSLRNVLLRGIVDERLRFFTNYESRKGVDLADNRRVALLFSWLRLRRQVRVEGVVTPVSPEVSDDYFARRPRESRIGAWASRQSHVLTGRAELEALVADAGVRFAGRDVPRPANWGGYDVTPSAVEFWQGRPGRLHDRLQYRRDRTGGAWVRERLAP